MDRRTVLLGSLGFAVPASAGNLTQQGETAKSLKVIPKTGDLAGEVLYTNSVAVIIGISKYQHLDANAQLRYARKDAEDVREVLIKSFGFLASNIVTLVDDAATKKGIERALDQLSRTKPTDRVLVFYSGHGMTVKGSSGEIGVLVPYDAQVKLSDTSDGIVPECILMDVLWKYLQKAPAKHRLLIADACFSGLLAKSRALEAYNPAVLKRLIGEPALQAITASGKLEVSKENDELKNGVFTRKFIDVLTELAAAPGRVMTAREVADSVARRVSNATKAQQNPQYGDYEGTEGQFLFVSIDPGATPNLAAGTAKVTRKNVRAILNFTGIPTGAKVKVDGKVISGSTYEVDLIDEPTKDVAVYITADGYEPLVSDVILRSGETVQKPIAMTKIPKCKLVFIGVPAGGVIKVDGKKVDGTELIVDMTTVETKNVSVVITSPGFKADVADVDLVKGETIRYSFAGIPEIVPSGNAGLPEASRAPEVLIKKSLGNYPALNSYIKTLREIPNGSFFMGGRRSVNELPVHKVNVTRFRMASTPVTVQLWREYVASMGIAMPVPPKWGWIDDHPVVNVSWNAIAGTDGEGGFCMWASNLAGFRLTLPTEAQWEYVARGGKEYLEFPWGNEFDKSLVWCSDTRTDDAIKTAPINRLYRIYRNEYGIADMTGNVWQWCSDFFGQYHASEQTDPRGPKASTTMTRVIRGSSWYDIDRTVGRCAGRMQQHPTVFAHGGGFRLSAGPI